ncbi:hypothetical protein ES705_35842 [subsurface metagenome]
MPITIGSEPIVRTSDSRYGYTRILKANPAIMTGDIEKIAVYASQDLSNFQVGIFEHLGSNIFTTRSTQVLGNYAAGYHEIDVNLQAVVGDYLGSYQFAGWLEADRFGEGSWAVSGDRIPCTDTVFTWYADWTISLQGWFKSLVLPPLNFAVLDVQYCQNPTQVKITAVTDIDVHLWARWSTVEPRRHPAPVTTRGITLMTDIRFCFTVYQDLEQVEADDTWIHTFYLPVHPVCTWFYFYLWGTRQSFTSPSTSAIFKAHQVEPFKVILLEPWSS